MKTTREIVLLGVGMLALVAHGFKYNVCPPDDVLRPKWFAADTAPGVWTLNVQDAKAKAQAAGACTILYYTGAWWCPFCKTLEETVFKSAAWKDYVAQSGFYLAMQDFPYRGDVPADQADQSWHPELGKGWGFKCWLMCPDYLSEIGLSAEEGLQEIMSAYELQKELADPEATEQVISNWNGTASFAYGKLGYPTFIVYGPSGEELGRAGFPWYQASDVTPSEAQEYVIQSIERLVSGECTVCDDPLDGSPEVSSAQVYRGWLENADGAVAGLIEVKTGRKNAKGVVAVSGSVSVAGSRKVSFGTVRVENANGKVCIVCGDEEKEWSYGSFTLEKAGTACVANLALGANGLTGTYSDGRATYRVQGGRDMFNASDASAKENAATCPRGVWSVVLKSAEAKSPSPFARGFGALSLELKAKGRAKISGSLGNGSKVNLSAQAIVGDNGLVCVPVVSAQSGKKDGFGFVVWFKDGKLLCFSAVAPWTFGVGAEAFSVACEPSATMSAGIGNVPDELDFAILDFDAETTLGGLPLAQDPSIDTVKVVKNRWQGSSMTAFKATCAAKTGLLKGSMVFQAAQPNGRTRRFKGLFSGVVMGGSAYGTVRVNGEGSWAVKVAVCGGCSE